MLALWNGGFLATASLMAPTVLTVGGRTSEAVC